jgi:hypothetical protein
MRAVERGWPVPWGSGYCPALFGAQLLLPGRWARG